MGRVAAAVLWGAALAMAPASPPVPAPEAVVETTQGRFVIRLRADLAPKHVAHFVKTATAGGYHGTTFHRIIPGGIVQGGDPYSKDPGRANTAVGAWAC
jgi:peptidyl-prolyl cis-trans isomerase B (cyclophilin B)